MPRGDSPSADMIAEFVATPNSSQRGASPHEELEASVDAALCFHCGTRCGGKRFERADKRFCCNGCLAVFDLLSSSGLGDYYSLNENAGLRVPAELPSARFLYLDSPEVRQRIVSYSDSRISRVTFSIPAIHCIACVWLLENLFRLEPGIGHSEVNFLRKEASVTFETGRIPLSQIVFLLASLGYEPELKLSDLDAKPEDASRKRLWMQLGVAGFAFGNNMLLSIALYLGVDSFNRPAFQAVAGYISLALALPVLLYSSRDYFRLAWAGLKHRLLTIEVPIAAGILVIFAQSTWVT